MEWSWEGTFLLPLLSVFPLKSVVEGQPKWELTLCETYDQPGASDFHLLGKAKSNIVEKIHVVIITLFCFFFYSQTKKSKKAAKKVTLAGSSAKAGRRDDFDAFGGGNYNYGDEFDDFM